VRVQRSGNRAEREKCGRLKIQRRTRSRPVVRDTRVCRVRGGCVLDYEGRGVARVERGITTGKGSCNAPSTGTGGGGAEYLRTTTGRRRRIDSCCTSHEFAISLLVFFSVPLLPTFLSSSPQDLPREIIRDTLERRDSMPSFDAYLKASPRRLLQCFRMINHVLLSSSRVFIRNPMLVTYSPCPLGKQNTSSNDLIAKWMKVSSLAILYYLIFSSGLH
jgi:hypothetical protein